MNRSLILHGIRRAISLVLALAMAAGGALGLVLMFFNDDGSAFSGRMLMGLCLILCLGCYWLWVDFINNPWNWRDGEDRSSPPTGRPAQQEARAGRRQEPALRQPVILDLEANADEPTHLPHSTNAR